MPAVKDRRLRPPGRPLAKLSDPGACVDSSNFFPLKANWPDLYEYGSFAERYAHTDPHSATIKLRCFAESLVGIVYSDLRLNINPADGFFERLIAPEFQDLVDRSILDKLHALRLIGNKAAHGKKVDHVKVLRLLEEAYLVGRWFVLSHTGNQDHPYPDYVEPVAPRDADEDRIHLERRLEQAKADLAELAQRQKEAAQEIAALRTERDDSRIREFKAHAQGAAAVTSFRDEPSRQLVEIEDAFASYELTPGQSDLVHRLGQFLSGKTESVFLLKGYAGTGKTFITKGLTDYFKSIGRNYILAAPTGKASKVIASKTESEAYTIHKTIYSFDDIAEYRDRDEEGTETYKFYAKLAVNSLSADTVYIVDEASMISDVYQEAEFFRFGSGHLLTDFLKFVNLDHNDHRKKIIFIGDNAQLPPVGMAFSPALDEKHLLREHSVRSTTFELTEVVRQKVNSGVLANAAPLRMALAQNVFSSLGIDFSFPDVAEVQYRDLIPRYLESCGGRINGESIIIAHSNADVADYNNRVREHFFPGLDAITAGDKVMAVANSDIYGVFISNGDFGLIRRVSQQVDRRSVTLRRRKGEGGPVEEIPVVLSFRDVEVGFKDLNGRSHFFDAKVIEDLLYSKEPNLSSDQNKALYLDFCIRHPGLTRASIEFKQTLRADPYFNALRLKFGYAITCHKAQGSEWNHVFVKCRNHQSQLSADYFRWLYTAVTRTAKHLYLLDPPNHKVGGDIKMTLDPRFGWDGAVLDQTDSPHEGVARDNSVESEAGQSSDLESEQAIPIGVPFLNVLLFEVRGRLREHDVVVEAIQHNPYQETYTLQRDTESARIDIGYNGKRVVTSIVAPRMSDFSTMLVEVLLPLKGLSLQSGMVQCTRDQEFDEPFLGEFHKRLFDQCAQCGIRIRSLERKPWTLRYEFVKHGQSVKFDIWYTAKSQFSRCQPVSPAAAPTPLMREISLLLTERMKS